MKKKFKDIPFPLSLEYSSDSDHVPFEFYLNVFPIAKEVDMHLGYFSSNAIKVLSSSFAQFIYNGGKLRLAINNFLTSVVHHLQMLRITQVNIL